MSAETILSWLLCGLIVGLISRLLVPGRQGMGILMTIVLGIVGSVVGGYLYSLVENSTNDPFTFAANAWPGWIAAILGGILVLWAHALLFLRR